MTESFQTYRRPAPVQPALGRAARRGVTLIEAVLYIAVALGLIVGGLVFYQQASRAAQWQDVRRGIEAVNSEVRALYQVTKWNNQVGLWNQPNSNAGESLTKTLIAMGSVPAEMISSNGRQIVLAHDGWLQIYHAQDPDDPTLFNIVMTITKVPQWLCTRLLPTTKNGPNAITGDGVLPAIRAIVLPNGNAQANGNAQGTVRLVLRGLETNRYTRPNWVHGDITPDVAAQYCRQAAQASSDGTFNVEITTAVAL